AALALLDELGRVAIAHRDLLGDRMIGRDGDEAGAEDRVGTRGVDFDRLAVRKIETELQALALSDPVLLHQPDLLGPVVEAAEAGEQVFGKSGDLEEPLVELALLDHRAGAPAAAVDDLLVGEHRLVDRVPVYRALAAIDQASLVKVDEQRLLVAVVLRVASGELAAPVEREAEALELRLHRR